LIKLENDLYLEFPSAQALIDVVSTRVIGVINGMVQEIHSANSEESKSGEPAFGVGVFGFGMSLSIDEALKNAILHGNKSDSSKLVRVNYLVASDRLEIMIKDEGQGFDHESLSMISPDQERGRGLLLIKSFMDEVRFEDKGSKITMIKRLTGKTL
jgi:two-component sensor histidine kinase